MATLKKDTPLSRTSSEQNVIGPTFNFSPKVKSRHNRSTSVCGNPVIRESIPKDLKAEVSSIDINLLHEIEKLVSKKLDNKVLLSVDSFNEQEGRIMTKVKEQFDSQKLFHQIFELRETNKQLQAENTEQRNKVRTLTKRINELTQDLTTARLDLLSSEIKNQKGQLYQKITSSGGNTPVLKQKTNVSMLDRAKALLGSTPDTLKHNLDNTPKPVLSEEDFETIINTIMDGMMAIMQKNTS